MKNLPIRKRTAAAPAPAAAAAAAAYFFIRKRCALQILKVGILHLNVKLMKEVQFSLLRKVTAAATTAAALIEVVAAAAAASLVADVQKT
jgi:hypothetical protein